MSSRRQPGRAPVRIEHPHSKDLHRDDSRPSSPQFDWSRKAGPKARSSRRKPVSKYAASSSGDDSHSNHLTASEEDENARDDDDNDEYYGGLSRQPDAIQRQPLRIVDWRGEMCRLLGLDMLTTDDTVLEQLAKTEIILQEEAQRARSEAHQLEDLPPRGQVLYRINCAESSRHDRKYRQDVYLEEPWVSHSGPYGSHLRAGDAIRNFELFLERAKDISFLIYKDFECCGTVSQSAIRGAYDDTSSPIASHFVAEYISIVSPALSAALQALSRGPLKGIRHPDFSLNSRDSVTFPYLWWYHCRDEISDFEGQLDPSDRQHIDILKEYLLVRLGASWDTVDDLILRGKITSQYVEYLYLPDEVVVSTLGGTKHTRIQGAVADSWLGVYRGDYGSTETAAYQHTSPVANISVLQWSFDGNFQQDASIFRIKNLPAKQGAEIDITELEVYPARFAEAPVIHALKERGKMFWKCRKRRYVCYNDTVEDTMNISSAQRFMVDIAIYKEMHPQDDNAVPNRNDLATTDMLQDKPPLGNDFLLCLPTVIAGFNMQKKEWVTLDVGNIKDVEWNRDAFEMLVADEETKELVRALVENHCNAEKNTDLISGKGNGLFVLLHGAPGTGKTLTAETVAEIAEKPLYRVTCGDIGTKAEDVEKYLETVLLLGKTWGCVVLLDEADVFLEERTLYDLQRNALVSVFLRVLEYYEGILILTSNRVGIFDEAFKSRIQLTLRYKNLAQPQRKKKCHNLITRLEEHQNSKIRRPKAPDSRASQEHEIDFKDILDNIDELAKVELNGRQIRNAVSTARQLAMFRGKSMQFSHLKVVINESEKFDSYLKEVTGLSQDMIQRDKGLR